MAIVSYTAEEMKKMPSMTDWGRVKNMKDEEIVIDEDSPEWTDDDFARAIRSNLMSDEELKQLIREKSVKAPSARHELKLRRWRGRPKKAVTKQKVTIRFAADDLVKLRALGKGWQTRVSNLISEAVKRGEV